MTGSRGKRLGRWLAAGLLSLPLVILMLRWLESKLVYVPSRTHDWSPALVGWPHEAVTLATSDGVRVCGWFMPGRADPSNAPVALLLHGNGGNISHRAATYALLREAGLSVFALDYRGYGQSEGRPGEEGTYLDAEAAWSWLRQRGFEPSRILIMGESLGGGVASELARRQPPGGLILQSTFTSIPDIGGELFPWIPRCLARIHYDTRAKLPSIRCPVLILHSRTDDLIHFAHAEKNFAAANEPKMLREILGGHNATFDTPEGREKFLRAIQEFTASLPKTPPAR